MSDIATSDRSLPATTTALLRVDEISKAFGGAMALDTVSLDVRPGVVHGLVGANGAGKSTLIRCLAGVIQPDSGSILIDGEPVTIHDPQAARELGLAFIHQEMSLIPGWDVLRNMALGRTPVTRAGLIDWRPSRQRAGDVARELGFTFPLSAAVDDLSTADKWLILIGRALMSEARMIAMDEPTASLSAREADRVHEIIRNLAARGTAVIFVSHRLDEVSDLCTDTTVFKDGKVALRTVGSQLSKIELVNAIVGRELVIPDHGHAAAERGPLVLEVDDVTDDDLVRGVSLRVHRGEIVGLGGLVGSGRSELVKGIYGARRFTSGAVRFEGRHVSFRHPSEAVRAGIGLVPEERRTEGVFLDESIAFNINIATIGDAIWSRLVPVSRTRLALRRAEQAAQRATVKSLGVGQEIGELSGGNQQKVAIARWFVDPPRLLILDEPSRGVDVGARADLYAVIRDLAAQGTAVLVVSSDNDELVALCDRVVVMAEGRATGSLDGPDITVDHLLQLSFSSREPEEAPE